MSRRRFLERASAAGIALGWLNAGGEICTLATGPVEHDPARHSTKVPSELQLNALTLPRFVDALPLPDVIRPSGKTIPISMREVRVPLHRDLPPARLWTYAAGDERHDAVSSHPLSPLLELRSGEPVSIEWIQMLPREHLFTIDYSIHGCGRNVPAVRAVTHMHGARVRPEDDGYPEDWFVHGQSRVCHYPMRQEAATLWYHDHAMGINRLNIYAGLMGMALVRDRVDDALELPRGRYEVPLILYDRMLTRDGQLLYPVSDNPARPWVPEFSGDALCVNGKITPYFKVEPLLYRFRVLNAANSRFYLLQLAGGKTFHQIGSDQGLLAAPVAMKRLSLAPGERADLLVDFSEAAGQNVHLLTGVEPMLEFRVATQGTRGPAIQVPAVLCAASRIDPAAAVLTRRITLNEYDDRAGFAAVMLLNRKYWHEPVTEIARLNTTEVWEFVNLTDDTHPMHLHQVRFQILDRRLFDRFTYLMYQKMRYTAEASKPEPQEMGWKDVVQCPPGMVTRIAVHFEGFAGRYLYHCHILEHEANMMMRPYEIRA
jgi:spore coat protein A, manganese oxidase